MQTEYYDRSEVAPQQRRQLPIAGVPGGGQPRGPRGDQGRSDHAESWGGPPDGYVELTDAPDMTGKGMGHDENRMETGCKDVWATIAFYLMVIILAGIGVRCRRDE